MVEVQSPAHTAQGKEIPQDAGNDPVYDRSQLSLDQGLQYLRIHRDYLAHALRFEFLIQRIKKHGEQAMILDVGCADVPLMRAIRSSMLRPKLYVGIDVRKRIIEGKRDYYQGKSVQFPFALMCLDFTEAPQGLIRKPWTTIVCLEVLEHMPAQRGIQLLKNFKMATEQGGTLYLSTPCYDGRRKAKGHKYEWRWEELAETFLNVGFQIRNNWGTFSNVYDLKKVLTPEERIVWENLSQANGGFYGNIALSAIFSPLHPEAARNSIWELTS